MRGDRKGNGARTSRPLAAAEVGFPHFGVGADRFGRTGCDWPARIEDDDVVRNAHHERHVVLDKDHGEAGVGDPAQHGAQRGLVSTH
jgi:hypothetical protein